jgi:hypothetical protein
VRLDGQPGLETLGRAHRIGPATLKRAEAILVRAGRVAVPIHRDMISRDMALGVLEDLERRQAGREARDALRRARYAIVRLPVVRQS